MARKRPPNSLLAEGLTFDHVAAPGERYCARPGLQVKLCVVVPLTYLLCPLCDTAPEMTSERVLQIEDIIKKRIADDIFDDVQFKEKGTDKVGN